MLNKRIQMALLLIPIGVLLAWLGGIPMLLVVIALLVIGSKELSDMAGTQGIKPNFILMAAAGIAFPLTRYFLPIETSHIFVSLFLLLAMAVHVFQKDDHQQNHGASFFVTLAGIFYLGWLGSYFISLREMPDGRWWMLLSFVAISLGDAGAYFLGSRFGKHKLVPTLSPNKTVEGYLGGVAFTFIGAVILAAICSQFVPAIKLWHGLVLGAVLGILAPIGDLTESMIKRQFGAKDSGTFFKSHGGVLDRLDSWLWGGVLAYYVITLLF
ncbi:MAG TPA: phosphatidate cytidylyltransferase [Bellilinea sp.]|nr:phosphatidate cytidylyltransferase [Bellilinea sp.]